MNEPCLEVTFRDGRPVAAYLYLRRSRGPTAQGTRRLGEGLVLDLTRDGVPLGVEITAPKAVTPDALDRALAESEGFRSSADRERRSLARQVVHLLGQAVEEGESRSLLELKGLGKECWQGIDANRHVDNERAAWDGTRIPGPRAS